ncbi:hypothetical protein [Paenibacillus sp. UNC451MF]|uniref:hypothetical protein n=1 Tax=Paenibacillus sp. UNC451MF TaxID=1449063 RepID=UPI00048E9B76|nr:hypothetical protein [Paenibacillus sp. UNC451MF]
MQYIIFGIIAVVGLVFLIVYNLKVESNRKKRESEMSSPTQERIPEAPSEPVVSVEAAPPQAVPSATPPAVAAVPEPVKEAPATAEPEPPDPKIRRESSRGDHDYRQALRSFESSEKTKDDSEEDSSKTTKDNQFRDALRSMNKNDQ